MTQNLNPHRRRDKLREMLEQHYEWHRAYNDWFRSVYGISPAEDVARRIRALRRRLGKLPEFQDRVERWRLMNGSSLAELEEIASDYWPQSDWLPPDWSPPPRPESPRPTRH